MDRYRGVTLQKELMDKIEEYIKTHPEMGYKSLADFVTDALRGKCRELQILVPKPELPAQEHFNLNADGVRILDRTISNGGLNGRIIDVYFKPKGIRCEYCQSDDCRHIHFALTVPAIKEVIEKKRLDGWKLPQT
jgi:hypothetical protein